MFMSARCLACWFSMGLCSLFLLVTGCERAPAPAPVSIEVAVSPPIERSVIDHLDFTGRTQARDAVQLRARIGGYLQKINFADGAEVQEGQVLFEIDDRTYRAQRDLAQAEVTLTEAQVKGGESENRRDVARRRAGTVREEKLEKGPSTRETCQTALDKARGRLE